MAPNGHPADGAGPSPRRARGAAALAVAVALVTLILHVLAGPGHLDDIDAINFTLGVRDYDVARHQPHPPGYPLLIAAGKVVAGAARAAAGLSPLVPASWRRVPVETAALSLLAMIGGALLVLALLPFARAVLGGDESALLAAALAIACPLAFVTASRPLSDAPGLAAAVGVQALLATAFVRQAGWRTRAVVPAELAATGRLVVLAALGAGLAIGLRSQTAWLTLPLLAVVIADRAGRAAAAAIIGSVVAFTAGVLLWALPLVVVSGGPAAYWRAMASQAGEDLDGVDMLLTSTRPVWRLAMNLLQTFVLPWGPLPVAVAVLTLAGLGAMVLLRRDRRALVLVAAAAGPYALFHLVWQENATTRYALPIVPALAILAVAGLRAVATGLARTGAASRWTLRGAGAALVAPCLAAALAALTAYTSQAAPIFRALADMRAATPAGQPAPVVAMHRRAFGDTARVRGFVGPAGFPWRLLPAPPQREWLELVHYWRDGGRAPVWLLADPTRTDLALIDPYSRRAAGRYDWTAPYAAGVLGGTRPGAIDWIAFDRAPAWFLGEGWALSPEIAGVSDAGRRGPSAGGAVGWLRADGLRRRLVVGGRNLAPAGSPAARFTLSVADRAVDSWDAAPGFFLRSLELPAPAGGLTDALVPFQVSAVAADGSSRVVPTAVEQFGLQPLDRVQAAFGSGWHEDELQPRTGLRWRWSSGEAWLHVWPADRDVRIRLVAESPLKTFDEAPIVTLTGGVRELARLTPDDAFTIDVVVPAAALRDASGRIALRSSRTFVPADHVGAGDPRRGDRRALGLRIFEASVTDAGSPQARSR